MKVIRKGLALLPALLALALLGCATLPQGLRDAEQLANEAQRLLDQGLYEESAAKFSSSLTAYDVALDEWYSRPDWEEREDPFEDSWRASVCAGEALANIGAGDYEGAIESAREAVSLNGGSARNYYALGLALVAASQADAARPEVAKLRALDAAKADEVESLLRNPKPAEAVKQAFYARTPFARGLAAYNAGNFKLAYQLWLPLAEKGDSAAQHNVGLLYQQGNGADKDDAKAFQWFLKAAQQGEVAAMSETGAAYRYGRGTRQDSGEALKWLQAAAEKGETRAAYEAGMIYYEGEGRAQDHKAALRWFRLAADGKDPDAQVMLGYMYENGQEVKADPAGARELYRLAADQNSAVGQYNLGVMYQNGTGGEKNEAEAARRYRQSADNGYESGIDALRSMSEEGSFTAQYELATLLLEGKSMPADDGQAVGLLESSADQGYAPALEALGDLYVEGTHGVSQDPVRGEQMLQTAAAKGDYGAMVMLGRLYGSGKGPVRKDVVQAYMWYEVAIKKPVAENALLAMLGLLIGDSSSAIAAQAELTLSMTEAQIAAAKRKAAEWIAAHP